MADSSASERGQAIAELQHIRKFAAAKAGQFEQQAFGDSRVEEGAPMSDTKAGEQDVPVLHLELRDWFAGQALIAVVGYLDAFNDPGKAAAWSYELADAMLKAREVSHA